LSSTELRAARYRARQRARDALPPTIAERLATGAALLVGRSGGMPKAILLPLRSEERIRFK
jgi:hypothetical protein